MSSRDRMSKSKQNNEALLSALERARMDRQTFTPSSQIFSTLLMGVFFLALMLALLTGTIMYRSTSRAQMRSNDMHLQSGLLTNLVRNNDFAGALGTGEGPEGPALVLYRTLASGTYETRIYLYQGMIMQEFTKTGRPYNPGTATALFESKTFEFETDGQLLTLITDEGNSCVALRSNQSSAQSNSEGSIEDMSEGVSDLATSVASGSKGDAS